MPNLLKKMFYPKGNALQAVKLLADIRQVKIMRTILTNEIEAPVDCPRLLSISNVLNSCKSLKLFSILSLFFVIWCSAVLGQDTTTVFNKMMANCIPTKNSKHRPKKVYSIINVKLPKKPYQSTFLKMSTSKKPSAVSATGCI